MPGGQETWIETAERMTLFRNQTQGAEAVRLLEISPTNRLIASRDQGIILQVVDLIASRMENYYPGQNKYNWTREIGENTQKYQLTMTGYSREQFMKVAIGQYQGANKNKAMNELEAIIK